MVKVTFTNNATPMEKIVDETKTIGVIVAEAGFTYAGADLYVNGIPGIPLDTPLIECIGEGATTARITAVQHKSNA